MGRRFAAVLALLLTVPFGSVHAQTPALFEFRSGVWGNLHHFLYVLGRAQNGAPDRTRAAVVKAPLDVEGLDLQSDGDRAAWKNAVRFYAAGPSRKDLVFDDELIRTTRALMAAPDSSDLFGLPLDPQLVATLRTAATVYRRTWWARHSQANASRRSELQVLLDTYGTRAVARLTTVYGTHWPPQPRTIDLCAYTNWAGAYSTDGGLIAISSTDAATSGSYGLETLLHESSHQWDDEIARRLSAIAAKQGRPVPGLLSHAMIFYASGAIVHELIPGHEPYATKFGVWDRGMSALKPLLDKYWQPYLKGTGTFDEAVAAMIADS